MEIQIKGSNSYGTEVHYKADNVHMTEDVYETIYGTSEDGKIDYGKRLGRDITKDVLDKFCGITEDLMYYREAEYDSSTLIQQLLNKLPEKEKVEVYKQLKEEFDENV
jgi:hypothetical protein